MAHSIARSMPRAFSTTNASVARFYGLQQKMMDNGWNLYEDENGNRYFQHKTYGSKKFRAHAVYPSGREFILPMVEQDEDPKGLGCSFDIHYGTGMCEVVSNEWVSYWDTRKGRRREKYLVYLDNRMKKRETIEKENAKANKATM